MTEQSNPDDTTAKKVDLDPDVVSTALTAKGTGADAKVSPVVFAGLLADDDPGDDRIRLYQDYELRTYVLLRRQDVLHRERVKNAAGVDVSMVWIDKAAQVTIREVSSEQMQATLLSQALQQAESGQYPSATEVAAAQGTTPATPILTMVFCTNITCSCTSRHSLICSLFCTDNWACRPLPITKMLKC